jgi:translation initiation factor IF-2
MAQTKEAISHAKAAKVPIIVAVNKIDKPGADVNRVKTELMSYELVPEEFGGDVIVIPVSAKTGEGLDKLQEAILLQAEVLELKANPDRSAMGAVIEAKIDRGRGVVATLLVQKGSLRVGDIVVAGASYGRVRAITDDKGRSIEEAGPSQPVEIQGLTQAPEAGDEFAVVDSEKTARDITEYRAQRNRTAQTLLGAKSLDSLFAASAGTKAKELPVIIKSDVQGTAEALSQSVQKFSGDEVTVRVLHSGVGAITESDITLANATGALIIGFNVRATSQARDMAARDKVNIRYYSIIYDVVEDIRAALSGMLSPTLKENFLGYAEIREIFNLSKSGKVAGCMVTEGMVKRGAKVRLLRDNVVIHNGTLKTLRRFKDDVKEVSSGMECGMAFENYDDIRVGDMIEAYEIEEVARSV